MAGFTSVFSATTVPPCSRPDAASVEDLLRFAPLRILDDESLAELMPFARLETRANQDCLFQLADSDDHEYFLLSGELKLVAADGRVHRVAADSPVAQQPLARLRPRHYSAVVESGATLLVVDSQLLTRLQEHMQKRVQMRYGVEEIQTGELAPESEELLLFRGFKEDCRHHRVHLPSLPAAVVGMRKLIRLGCSDSAELSRVAVMMPELERFLVHVANSPFISSHQTCQHCITAIERIGAEQLPDLLLIFSAHWLHARVADNDERVWQFSLGVAAYGWWLADRTGLADPMQALTLGLLHNVTFPIAIKYMQDSALKEENAWDDAKLQILSLMLCRDITLLQFELWDIDEKYCQSLPVMYNWQTSGKMLRPDLPDVLQTARYLQLLIEGDHSLPSSEKVVGLARISLYEQQLMNARAIRPDVIKVLSRLQRLFVQ